jgi:CDP-diacylglycerol--serine O-phosphatidyltransferase
VARLTNTASEFGIQYDSLADAIAFGVAPGFLAWAWHLNEYGRIGGFVCAVFVACAALRLARFNVSTAVVGKKFFIGIPSPAAGCLVALFVLFATSMPEWFDVIETPILLIVTLGAGLLMVSQVRYFSFKEYAFVQAYPFRTLVAVVCVIALLVASPRRMGFLFTMLYMFSGIIYTYFLSRRDKKRLNSITGL